MGGRADLVMQVTDDETIGHMTNTVFEMGAKANQVSSHADGTRLTTLDINETLDSALDALWSAVGHKADIKREYGTLPEVEFRPLEIVDVFLGVLVHAADSIKDHGEIRVRTWAENSSVCVRISDNGDGILRQHLAHVFDPFFSTTAIGIGAGLGLTIAHHYVKKNGGHIEVESDAGRGTSFTIRLPLNGRHSERSGAQKVPSSGIETCAAKKGDTGVLIEKLGKEIEPATATAPQKQ